MAIRKLSKIKEENVDKFIKGKQLSEKRGSEQISLRLPLTLLEAIDVRAEQLSISRAAYIKQSCARQLEID